MDNRPIGVFDSGLGGLTVVKCLKSLLPGESIIYFGDTGRVPYGTRSNETIRRYAEQDIGFLMSHDVKMVIAACGTVSSVAADVGSGIGVPFIEVVSPASRQAAASTANGRIGVIGTQATIGSGSYRRCIGKIDPEISVFEKACPLFVPLVENGFIDPQDEIVKHTVRRYIEPLLESGIDTLILGCTHYPILAPAIQEVCGSSVRLINMGESTAAQVSDYLSAEDMLGQDGSSQFYVSDTPDSFERTAEILLGSEFSHIVRQIDIESY